MLSTKDKSDRYHAINVLVLLGAVHVNFFGRIHGYFRFNFLLTLYLNRRSNVIIEDTFALSSDFMMCQKCCWCNLSECADKTAWIINFSEYSSCYQSPYKRGLFRNLCPCLHYVYIAFARHVLIFIIFSRIILVLSWSTNVRECCSMRMCVDKNRV